MGQNNWVQDWSKNIGLQLQYLRRQKGFKSAEEFAEQCRALGFDVNRSTIANIESGRKREIPVHEIAIYAAALGVPPIALLFPMTNELDLLPKSKPRPGIEWAKWFRGDVPLTEESIYNHFGAETTWFFTDPSAPKLSRRMTSPTSLYLQYTETLNTAAQWMRQYDTELQNMQERALGVPPSDPTFSSPPFDSFTNEDWGKRFISIEASALDAVEAAHAQRERMESNGHEVPPLPPRWVEFLEED